MACTLALVSRGCFAGDTIVKSGLAKVMSNQYLFTVTDSREVELCLAFLSFLFSLFPFSIVDYEFYPSVSASVLDELSTPGNNDLSNNAYLREE